MKQYTLRRDRFLRLKGGIARILTIFCERCGTQLLVYQKDGIGRLKRCYLDRILDPPPLATLQGDSHITNPKAMPRLACLQCTTLIGVPVRHHTGRLAFHLLPGTFAKRGWKAKWDRENILPEKAESSLIPAVSPTPTSSAPPALRIMG